MEGIFRRLSVYLIPRCISKSLSGIDVLPFCPNKMGFRLTHGNSVGFCLFSSKYVPVNSSQIGIIEQPAAQLTGSIRHQKQCQIQIRFFSGKWLRDCFTFLYDCMGCLYWLVSWFWCKLSSVKLFLFSLCKFIQHLSFRL